MRTLVVALLAIAVPCQDADLVIPQSELKLLESAARDLVTIGRGEQAREVIDLLGELGYPERAIERLEAKCAALELDLTKAPRVLPSIVKNLTRTAERLTKRMPKLAAEQQPSLARKIVQLVTDAPAAQQMLGRVKVGNQWLTAEEMRLRPRRLEIQDALRRARRLEFSIDLRDSDHPDLVTAYGQGGLTVSHGKIAIETAWPEPRARRLLSNLLRAVAFSRWLVHGVMEIHPDARGHFVLLDSRPVYLQVIEEEVAAGRIVPQRADIYRKTSIFHRPNGPSTLFCYSESGAVAGLFCYLTGIVATRYDRSKGQACVLAGHGNWVLQTILGTSLPLIAWQPGSLGSNRTRSNFAGSVSFEEMRLRSSAGLMGCRSWLRYLARRGEDPTWTRSMVDDIGKVDREDLLKSTTVVEYLQEHGPLGPLLEGTKSAAGKSVPQVIASFEAHLGLPLSEFEQQWRAWLLESHRSLVDRLHAGRAAGLSTTERELLEQLNAMRRNAFQHPGLQEVPEVTLNPELSTGAELHAEYLGQNLDQITEWPGAYEEYTDREGFTVEGAWAGSQSVIAPGVRNAREALDRWMGSFYHRLPLLDPGLLCVGWGFASGTAILDANSIVRGMATEWTVAWPYDGMREVPLTFSPELPNPVPGADQLELGYPITFQALPDDSRKAIDLEMSLHVGSPDGAEVPCHFSSPQSPSNPALVPDRAFCLIPERHLASRTTYWVVARSRNEDRVEQWSFRTR